MSQNSGSFVHQSMHLMESFESILAGAVRRSPHLQPSPDTSREQLQGGCTTPIRELRMEQPVGEDHSEIQ